MYAVGKIPGGFNKREGRPSQKAILASRLTDRPMRPLFAEGFRNDVQIVNLVMSVDQDCTPEITAMIGTSAALAISDVPFNGPIGGVIVGRINGRVHHQSQSGARCNSTELYCVVSGTRDAIMMVEAEAHEVSEEIMLEAIMFGHEAIKKIVDAINQFVAEVGKPKMAVVLKTWMPKSMPLCASMPKPE